MFYKKLNIKLTKFLFYYPTIKKSIVNLGPQHPAVHGVLRVILELNNENVIKAIPEIGYLHRGTEKLCEYNEYYKILPFFDRFDYVGLILCEHSYVLNLEKLLLNSNDFYAQYWRILLNELMRISSHFLALTTSAMDIGAISPFLWAFEEREELATLYENLSGARMHTALYKVGGLNFSINTSDLEYLFETVIRLKIKISEVYELLNNSAIWLNRMQNVGILNKFLSLSYALSGPVARSSGLKYDIRLTYPHELLKYFPISIVYGTQGDNLTRFFLRFEELWISLQYVEFLLTFIRKHFKLNFNSMSNRNQKITNYSHTQNTMENTIYEFKSFSEGFNINKNKSYTKIESPRGEFGVSVVSWNKIMDRPLRLKVRSPGFYNLSSINIVCQNYILSDLLSYLSTLDLILGEVDK